VLSQINRNKDSMKNFHLKGYFTVEAACIYPFVIAVILLVIYLWFFMYDRCLMEQDFAGILVKSAVYQTDESSERSEYMQSQVGSLYDSQYLCWDYEDISTSITGYNVGVSAKGSLEFPFTGLNFWSETNRWEAEREYTGKMYDRIFIIRTYRKLEGLLQ